MFYFEKDMTSESSNLIYVVVCSTFSAKYITETGERKNKGSGQDSSLSTTHPSTSIPTT